MTEKLQDIDYDIDKLPPMPLIATRMVELISSSRSSAEELAKVVSGDPAISARVLKIANSSFYSMARQVKTLSTAIVILGERTLRNLVMAASIRGMHGKFGDMEQRLWEDSMTCALGSRFLARSLRVGDPEEAFIAGLFRHIGRTVLNNQDPDTYRDLVTQHQRCGAEMLALEKAKFEINHAELGAAVLHHWQLSDTIATVALRHHDKDLATIEDSEARNLTAIANIASEFPLMLGIFGPYKDDVDLEDLPGAKLLGLDADRLEELFEEFSEVFEENRDDFLS